MDFDSIILFIVYTWGLGFSISFFIKSSLNFFERNIIRIGIGLGTIPVLGVILNLFKVPIDWKIFLLLSLVVPIIYLIKNHKKVIDDFSLKVKLTRANLYILIVFLLFIFTLFMYTKGAFIIPYMEDDDPWGHANSIKYVSIERTLLEPYPEEDLFHYIDTYPPGYDLIFAILHQTSKSLMWTMKFFNSLIISLGILFFYFFVNQFSKSRKKALIATFALVAVPSYLSHFIWAHALVVTLFIPAFYCLEKINEDKKWSLATAIVIASIFLVQPTQPIKFAILFFIYYTIKIILNKKFYFLHLLSFLIGVILSFTWWIPSIIRKGSIKIAVSSLGFTQAAEVQGGTASGLFSILDKIFHATGTATRPYSFNDFFIAKSQNMINNPIGVGIFLTLILILGVIWILMNIKTIKDPNNQWKLIALLWVLFTFLGIHGCTRLPVCLFSFRFWMLFAMTSVIIVPEGFDFLTKLFGKNRIIKYAITAILIIGIFTTSLYQKYSLNTAQWGPGGAWTSFEEINGYTWLKTLPPDTKVFPYNGWDSGVIGFDKFSCMWCENVMEFRKNIPEKSITDLHNFLKGNQYQYLIFDGMAVRNIQQKYGLNDSANFINQKINEAGSSGLFTIVHQTPQMVVFRVL